MDRFKARKIIRKASCITTTRIQSMYEKSIIPIGDVRKVILAQRLPSDNPNYQKFEKYMASTIPFEDICTALDTLPDNMLITGIRQGMKDAGGLND